MDEKLLEILDSYGLEIIKEPDDPRFAKGIKFNSKSLASEISADSRANRPISAQRKVKNPRRRAAGH